MRAAVSCVATAGLLMAGCFPHNPRARTISELAEGAVILGGIAVLAVSNAGADCEARGLPGVPDSNCKGTSDLATTAGLSMLIVGLVGFIATISTAQVDKKPVTIETVPAAVLQPTTVQPTTVQPTTVQPTTVQTPQTPGPQKGDPTPMGPVQPPSGPPR